MKRAFLLLVLSVPPTLFAATEPELKGSPAELGNYLAGQQVQAAVAGEAEVKVPADRAVVTLKLSSEHKSLKEASQASQKLRAALTAYLAEQGIGADRVQSAKFSSTPRTGSWSDKVKSYRIESELKVSVHDDKEFQAVSGALDKWSDVSYVGVEFAHSDKESMRLKAVGLACERAMARKKTIEEKLGVKLTVRRFNEGVDFLQPLTSGLRAQAIGFQGGTAPSYNGVPVTRIGGVGDAEEATAGFGELVFRARVILECGLESR